jgi:hypothetical protein
MDQEADLSALLWTEGRRNMQAADGKNEKTARSRPALRGFG